MPDKPLFDSICTQVHEIKLRDLHLGATAQQTENIRRYISNALSENTIKAYKGDIKHFIALGGVIPSTAEAVAAYLTDHAETLAMATLSRRLVSITKAHTTRGLPSPVQSDLVQLTLKGIMQIENFVRG